jgi:dienelactone hydrolase
MIRFRPSVRKITSALIAAVALLPGLAIEQELQLDYRLNEHVILIPAGPDHQAMLETTVFQPNGPGPFPLLIINHGKDPGAPSAQPRDRFYHMAHAFVERGYAVLVPMREGYANSTGKFHDHGCDMTANGYGQANDILDALNYAREQPWVDPQHIVVAGQSYGGLATIALGTQPLPGVKALLNFAGGLKDQSEGCNWKNELITAYTSYGANAKIPSLWMYGANDTLFGPDLAARMHAAYTLAGGQGKLVEYGPFKHDAHGMLASRDGEQIWLPETEQFLASVGMPTKVLYNVPEPPQPPKTSYANVDDITKVPFLTDNGRRAYQEYLTKLTPRAFAVSPSGAWTWAEEGEDPDSRALATCNAKSSKPCKLYSIDDYVVWNGDKLDAADKAALTASVAPVQSADDKGAVGGTAATTTVAPAGN